MPTLRIVELQRVYASGEVWSLPFKPGMNFLVGPDNTSKTTTLRIIDFCLGDDKSATDRFGRPLAAEYAEFRLRILVNGREHTVVRRLTTPRQTTLVEVDGELMTAASFTQWIEGRLDWGRIAIPKGLSSAAAQEEPLTFRALFRHVYRKADSWLQFASQEWEHYRRAVTAYHIGVAEQLYHGTQVRIVQAEQRKKELDQRHRELRATLDDVVGRVSEGFRQTGTTNWDSLQQTLEEIERQIADARTEREALASAAQSNPSYLTDQDNALATLNAGVTAADTEVSDLRLLLSEQSQMIQTLDGDASRIARARVATSAFESVLVRNCPACYQELGDRKAGAGRCYVCAQPVPPDVRTRRLDLEEQAVAQEREELQAAAQEIEARLRNVAAKRDQLVRERDALLAAIEEQRAAFLSPLLSEFERLQYRLGELHQRHDSLVRLSRFQDQIAEILAEQARVDTQITALTEQETAGTGEEGLVAERAMRLASFMNLFLANLTGDARIGGLVSVSSQGLAFFVGHESWETALGDERKVVFFLAYGYALMRLAAEEDTPYPKLAILDNPFQQDVDSAHVEVALQQYSRLCAEHPELQLIVATRRELDEIPAHRLYFTTPYNPADDDL